MYLRSTSLIGAILVMAVVVSSCGTTPVKRQERAADTLSDVTEGMVATRTQIDKTLTSLNALMSAPPNKLRDAYDQYVKDVDRMSKLAQEHQKHSQQLRERSAAWLSGWQKSHGEIQNPDLRTVSEGRRAQVMTRFDTINGSTAAAQQSFGPFLQNLQDVKRVLGNDLSSRGIDAVAASGAVQQANANGPAVARALDVATSDLQALGGTLSPAVK